LRRFARPRCQRERATSTGSRRRSVVAIDVNGPEDRGKDVSPCAGGGPLAWVHALRAHADDVPLLGEPRSTRGHRRERPIGKRPARTCRTGQDLLFSSAPRRASASSRSGAFHRRDHEVPGSFTPADLRDRPLAHAAHTSSPGWGQCLKGIASARREGNPRRASRERTPLGPANRAWD